jgi:hypothetical protein
MNAQILKLPKRLELEHYVTVALRKVDRILARLEDGDGQRERQADQSAR